MLWAREGAGGLGDFYAITKLSDDILQQRLQSVVLQRGELQEIGIELRAQAIAHRQIIKVQQSFQAATKEHATAVAKMIPHTGDASADLVNSRGYELQYIIILIVHIRIVASVIRFNRICYNVV